MNKYLEQYLYKDPDAYYIGNDGGEYNQSVHGNSHTRYNKAKEQISEYSPVPKEKIIRLILEFLNKVGISTSCEPQTTLETIDYSKIKTDYNLDDERDIVWLKFTEDKYLGVIAVSNDVNFQIPKCKEDYDKKHWVYNAYERRKKEEWVYNSAGILVHKLGKKWDDSFVLLFPLKNIPVGYCRGDVEQAIGNMLIENNVPIIDYFSHLY